MKTITLARLAAAGSIAAEVGLQTAQAAPRGLFEVRSASVFRKAGFVMLYPTFRGAHGCEG